MDAGNKKDTEAKAILVAEDDFLSMMVVTKLLKSSKFEVIQAVNGKEAVEKFQKAQAQLVLMDIQMPVMDGFTATRRIREIEAVTNSRVPIIALTAFALKGDREKCLEAGMDDYISKPVDINDLMNLILKWTK